MLLVPLILAGFVGLSPTTAAPQFVASLKSNSYRRDEPIPIVTRLINTTDHDTTIWSAGYWPNHLIKVTAGDGRQPPLTEAGRLRRQAFDPDARNRDKNAPCVLRPGESRQEGPDDLTTLFTLMPGRYRATVTYHDNSLPTPLRLTSNSVTFEVE